MDNSELTYETLMEAINLLPPYESDPVIGFKVNFADLRQFEDKLKENHPGYIQNTCSPFGFGDSLAGLMLFSNLKSPRGLAVPVRKSELPLKD